MQLYGLWSKSKWVSLKYLFFLKMYFKDDFEKYKMLKNTNC